MFAQWESLRVKMFMENGRKIPIYDSQKSPHWVKWKITQIHLHFSHFQLWIWRCSDSTNEPSMSALPPGEIHPHLVEQRQIFLMLNAPVRQQPASPQSLCQGIDIGSVLVLHPPLYCSDSPVSFSTLLLSHVMLQQQHPRGAVHVCHVGDMAAFQDEPIQLRLPFPGPNWWSKTPVFHCFLHRETIQ